jgi:hypothetical protein
VNLSDLLATTGTEVLDHLDRDAAIPHITVAGIQGDVSFRINPQLDAATTPVPAAGVPVVRGENGGNTHALYADGPIAFDAAGNAGDPADTLIGTLTVPVGSTAFLLHPEHGGMSFGPGTWAVGRQREQADVARYVAD